MRVLQNLLVLVAGAWAGSIWAIGFIAAPVVFKVVTDKTLAGNLAGQMFTVTAYMGIVCASMLLLGCWVQFRQILLRQQLFWIIVFMLGLTLAGEYVLQPQLASLRELAMPLPVMQSPYAAQFGMWHGISSILFLVQGLCGGWLLWKMSRKP